MGPRLEIETRRQITKKGNKQTWWGCGSSNQPCNRRLFPASLFFNARGSWTSEQSELEAHGCWGEQSGPTTANSVKSPVVRWRPFLSVSMRALNDGMKIRENSGLSKVYGNWAGSVNGRNFLVAYFWSGNHAQLRQKLYQFGRYDPTWVFICEQFIPLAEISGLASSKYRSPVNRAGWVSEISPRHSLTIFWLKFRCVYIIEVGLTHWANEILVSCHRLCGFDICTLNIK